MDRATFLSTLARPGESRIVLLVLDGVGDLRNEAQPETALERARTPNLDALAAVSALGRLDPVAPGITPGSGPGHLGLFGYDPADRRNDIGRGVLEALGLGLEVGPTTVAARGNFATVDAEGKLTDRRAGRIATEECERLCERIAPELAELSTDELSARIVPGEGYRFVLLFEGEGLSAELADTDPQRLGVEPLALRPAADAEDPQRAEETVLRLRPLLEAVAAAIADEERANSFLLRGFSRMPELPSFETLYRLRAGAFAGYPLYRGVASACGMEVVDCGKRFVDILERVAARWQDFDFFFLHVKQTDMAGEDGSLDAKIEVLEEVDGSLPTLLELGPDVLAITADHSTPAPMRAHSWHPVPLLVRAETAFVDDAGRFDELAALRGGLGTLPSRDLMGLLLAHAGRLAKYGA
jgi:2,3-bisphosphoglycerate-independent phosphoglycerate mutase